MTRCLPPPPGLPVKGLRRGPHEPATRAVVVRDLRDFQVRGRLPVSLSFSRAKSMPRATCLLVLILPCAGLSAAENTTVTQRIGDRQLTFGGRGKTKFAGLTVALLGSCSAETTLHFGNKEHWDEALKGDHLLVRFAKPQVFPWNDPRDSGKETELHASEILV